MYSVDGSTFTQDAGYRYELQPEDEGTMGVYDLFSFISEDGDTFTLEPGVRLKASDFTEHAFVSLHDPQVVQLPDGRFRIYVTGNLGDDGSGELHQMIVSATTNP